MRRLFKVLILGLSLAAATSLVDPAHAERGRSGFVRGGSSGNASGSRHGSWHGSGGSGFIRGGSRDHGYRDHGYRNHGSRDNGYRDRGSRGHGYRDYGYRDHGYGSRRYPHRGYHRGYHGSYRYRGYYPYYGYYSYPSWYYGGYSSWYWPTYLGWYWPSPWYWSYPRYYSYPRDYGYRGGDYDDTAADEDDSDGGWRGWGQSDTADRSAGPREGRASEPRSRQTGGMLRLRTAPGAAIYIDDRFAGAADRNGVLMLNVEHGTHSVAAVQPNQPALARSVKVGPDTRELRLDR